MKSSKFFGVYTNTDRQTNEISRDFPWRVSIRRNNNGTPQWVNKGTFKSEAVAAKVYNLFAVEFFGKKAIVNILPLLTPSEQTEYLEYVTAYPYRIETLLRAQTLVKEMARSGEVFRTAQEKLEQTVPSPEVQELAAKLMEQLRALKGTTEHTAPFEDDTPFEDDAVQYAVKQHAVVPETPAAPEAPAMIVNAEELESLLL